MLEEGHCLRDQSLAFCRPQNVSPNVVVRGSSLHSILNLVVTGFGCTFVPGMVLRSRPRENLRFIPFSDPKPHREIILARRSNTRLNAIDRRFTSVVQQCFD